LAWAILPRAPRSHWAKAEFRCREALANETDLDDEEFDRRSQDMADVRDQIEAFRPTTLRGVLAIFELGSEPDQLNDPDFWPEEAIKGLRDILEREPQR
jgi:hypothetical protein